MVEARLFWERHERPGHVTAAEFLCSRRGDDIDFEVTRTDASLPVVGGNRRRWVVKKVYLANEGEVTVDKWFVSSSVNYTCTEGRSLSFAPYLLTDLFYNNCLIFSNMHII